MNCRHCGDDLPSDCPFTVTNCKSYCDWLAPKRGDMLAAVECVLPASLQCIPAAERPTGGPSAHPRLPVHELPALWRRSTLRLPLHGNQLQELLRLAGPKASLADEIVFD
jgi:hypothetical protein